MAISIDQYPYYAHRLAWLMHYGKWPRKSIDHINHDKSDNRIANLRLCTQSQNRKNSKVKFKGITGPMGPNGRYRAKIQKDYKYIHLGYFPSEELARAAYVLASKQLFGEFAGN